MRTLFNILSIVSVTTGAIAGAGFITGSELVSFFGTENFLPLIFLSFALFFLLFATVMSFGKEYNGLSGFNRALLGSEKPFNVVMLCCSMVFTVSMLAGLDVLWQGLNLLPNLPILSITAIAVVGFITRRGIVGIERFNLILMPVVLLTINILIFSNRNLDFTTTFPVKFSSTYKVILYVSMNVFLALPVSITSSSGKRKKETVLASLITAVLLSIQSAVILAEIKGFGGFAIESQMPLYSALTVNGKVPLALFLSLLFAITTSLSTSYYPLQLFTRKKYGNKGEFFLGVIAFLLSRIGLKNIVEYVYPLIGAVALIYFIKCLFFAIKNRYKKNADCR